MFSLRLFQSDCPHRLTSYNLMGLDIIFLAFWLVIRIFIQNYVLKGGSIAMIDDIFRVVLDEKLFYFADILKMCSIKLYLLVMIERALLTETELIITGVVVETILIVWLS